MGKPVVKANSVLPTRRAASPATRHYDDPEMAIELPALYELLTTAIVDGEPRKGSKLTIQCSEGYLKVSIWDDHTDMCWFATLETWKDLLTTVDRMVAANKGEWREKRNPPSDGRR